MAQKASVYLADASLAVLSAIQGPAEERYALSGRINTIVGRYGEIVRRSMPELTLGEWCAVCDANNGSMIDVEEFAAISASLLWANVADSPGIGEKWGVDAKTLVKKLRGLSFAETIAVAEVVQRFWSDCAQTDNGAWLEKCGARVAKGK